MKDKLQEISEKLSTEIAGHIDAHLFESVVALFNQGVLKHYSVSPRTKLDPLNFHMSVEAASGVRFEGREKIVELEKENAELRKLLREAVSCMDPSDKSNDQILVETWDFLFRPEVKQFLGEGE